MDGNPENPISTEVDSGLAASGQPEDSQSKTETKTKPKKSKKERMLNDLALTFSVFAVVAVLMSVIGLATYIIGSGMIGWVCEICASFRGQLAVFLFVCTVAIVFSKPYRIVAFVCFGVALLNVLLISPVLDFNKTEKKSSTYYTFKVLDILVDTPAVKLDDVAKFADEKIDAEIVVYMDMNLTKVARMNAKMNQYVHKSSLPRAENKGPFIYSQFPLKGSRLVEVGADKVPITITTAFFETGWVNLVGFQAPLPDSAENFDKRNTIFEAVSKVVTELKGPVIVCANLNATPYSGAYHKFLSDSKLKSLRDNLSVKTNWYCGPADVLLNRFPVDNIFVNDKVTFLRRSVLDMNIAKVRYKPILGEFSVSNKDEKYIPPKLEKPKAPAVAPPAKAKKKSAKAKKKKVKKKSKRRSRRRK